MNRDSENQKKKKKTADNEVYLFGRGVGREGAPGHAGVVHGEVTRG